MTAIEAKRATPKAARSAVKTLQNRGNEESMRTFLRHLPMSGQVAVGLALFHASARDLQREASSCTVAI